MCFQGMFKKNKTDELSYFDRPENFQKKRNLQLLAFSLGLIAVTALLATLLIVTHGFGLAALAVAGKGGVGIIGMSAGKAAITAATGKGLTLFAAKAGTSTAVSNESLKILIGIIGGINAFILIGGAFLVARKPHYERTQRP